MAGVGRNAVRLLGQGPLQLDVHRGSSVWAQFLFYGSFGECGILSTAKTQSRIVLSEEVIIVVFYVCLPHQIVLSMSSIVSCIAREKSNTNVQPSLFISNRMRRHYRSSGTISCISSPLIACLGQSSHDLHSNGSRVFTTSRYRSASPSKNQRFLFLLSNTT